MVDGMRNESHAMQRVCNSVVHPTLFGSRGRYAPSILNQIYRYCFEFGLASSEKENGQCGHE